MIDYSKNFTQYINKFNHTHRFSKEFLDEILKQISILQSNINDRHQLIANVGKMLSSIICELHPVIFINRPLLEFMSCEDDTQIPYSLNYARLRDFIVYSCAETEQVFLDNDIINTRLSPTQTDKLADIVFELLMNNNDGVVEDMCEQLLQTDIGKQCIANIYNIIETHYVEPSEEDDMEMLQVLYPYAQKSLAADNITADDIKDLFDI